MTADNWETLLGTVVAVAVAVGPWMFKVHAKLAVIAARMTDLCDRLHELTEESRRLWSAQHDHQLRLDRHEFQSQSLLEADRR